MYVFMCMYTNKRDRERKRVKDRERDVDRNVGREGDDYIPD